MAFDLVTGRILNPKDNVQMDILYLGDSENDNPAFRKASLSVGIISDKRVNPKLDRQYFIEYEHLPKFLGYLADNRFVFSERHLDL